jgi:CO/xanthine dehydrogenase Mo-binding subunit
MRAMSNRNDMKPDNIESVRDPLDSAAKQDSSEHKASSGAELSQVGRRQPRLDGAEKVSGRSLFTDDIKLPNMLCGKVLRSKFAHARILGIDASKALALPGVKAVVTAADAVGITVNINEPPLCKDITRYIGEEIAAVAAIDEITAEEALDLIEVDYEPLPYATTLRNALRPGAPQIHPDCPGNIASDDIDEFGDPDKAFAEADIVLDDRFTTHPSHNLFAEFHVALADFSFPDKLTMWTPTQSGYLFQNSLMKAFKLSLSQVRIIHLNTGGAFTGRGMCRPHHYIAALLSRKTRRPVKVFSTGDEEFLTCRAGGENEYRVRTAVTRAGKIKGFEVDMQADTGAHPFGLTYLTAMASNYQARLFKIDGLRFHRRCAITNQRPNFFHHGGMMTGVNAAIMQQLARAAKQIDMDPMDLFINNAVDQGFTDIIGGKFASCGLIECLEKVRIASKWDEKYGKLPPHHGIGVSIGAMASGVKGIFKHDTSAAMLKIAEDGIVTLYTGIPDMGQGTHTTMAIIAAEVLGCQVTDIRLVAGDTDTTPIDIGAFTQRGTFTTGNAVRAAAADARAQLGKRVAAKLDVDADELIFRNGHIYADTDPAKSMPFKEAAWHCLHSQEGRFVMGRGFYNMPIKYGTMAWSFGAQVAEVKVNPDTGAVQVIKMTVAHDLGRAINPLAVEGQIDGQVFSGMSQALYEECEHDNGQFLNPSRLEYKMPRTYEMPEVEYILVETIDPYGPFGAKEVGEGPIVVTVGAIAAAVGDALGEYVRELPMSPWRVLRAIRRKQTKTAQEPQRETG